MADAADRHDHPGTARAGEPGVPGPVTVNTVVAGGWLLTMNPEREMYRAGAVAIDAGVIVEVGQRADLLTRYAPRRAHRRPGRRDHPGPGERAPAPAVLRQGGDAGRRPDPRRAAPVHLPVLRRPDRAGHVRARAARRRGDDPVRHDPVRGAGRQPPGRRAGGAGHVRDPGPDRPVDLGPGRPGRRGRPARLAADGREDRTAPAGRRDRAGPQVRPSADPGRGHHRGRGHLLRRAQPGRRRAGPGGGVPVRAAQVDQRA